MTDDNLGTVYLIHFREPLCHAQHYIGWAKDVERRCQKHKNGNGAKLMAAVEELGLPWEVVRIWDCKDRNFERQLKNQKNAKRICPICSGDKAYNRMKGE